MKTTTKFISDEDQAMTAPPPSLAEAARALMHAWGNYRKHWSPVVDAVDALRAALEAHDILSMSDEAVIAQAVDDGIDPANEAARGRELFEKAAEQTRPLNWKQAHEQCDTGKFNNRDRIPNASNPTEPIGLSGALSPDGGEHA